MPLPLLWGAVALMVVMLFGLVQLLSEHVARGERQRAELRADQRAGTSTKQHLNALADPSSNKTAASPSR